MKTLNLVVYDEVFNSGSFSVTGLAQTWRKYPVALSIMPANNLPHLLQCQLLHEHKNRRDLIGEPRTKWKVFIFIFVWCVLFTNVYPEKK